MCFFKTDGFNLTQVQIDDGVGLFVVKIEDVGDALRRRQTERRSEDALGDGASTAEVKAQEASPPGDRQKSEKVQGKGDEPGGDVRHQRSQEATVWTHSHALCGVLKTDSTDVSLMAL